jgi:xanthine/CO dehydrogenase XdhC/CoxF family maturation factor
VRDNGIGNRVPGEWAGLREADLERILSPIGLSIMVDPVAEIAVSIAAELIRIRSELNG